MTVTKKTPGAKQRFLHVPVEDHFLLSVNVAAKKKGIPIKEYVVAALKAQFKTDSAERTLKGATK